MEKKFNKYLFATKVTETMFSKMAERKEKRSVRNFGKEIGISGATFSRLTHGKEPDVNTFLKVCDWMQMESSKFYTI